MSASIGEKLKFFRKRADLSQFELENQVGLANGVVSRIENGVTNPTKETLYNIFSVLDLNTKEKDYLFGTISEPASEEELFKARTEVQNVMSNIQTLAYLLDDRARVLEISKGFIKLFSLISEDLSLILGHSFIFFVLNPRFKVATFIHPNYMPEMIFNMLSRFYAETHFFIDDPFVNEAEIEINKNQDTSKIWKLIKSKNDYRYQSSKERTVIFKFFEREFKLIYSSTILLHSRRFELVEYNPDAELSKLLLTLV
jgi:transcriptional regulator with XRE-family HTH domain